tara:strand:+ start:14479 stop:15789 length:1311 start_codon:yes stop_codon:yes gene_type:complete
MSAIPTQGSTYERIEITGHAGGTVDIRLGVSSFQYFEDLMSPVVTAVMGVVTSGDTINGQGLYSGLPIVGGEKVRIHITSPIETERGESPGEFDMTMFVNKVTDYQLEKQKETFVLHLVSKEGIVNLNKRIIKKYKQKRIDEVITDFLEILEADFEEDQIEKSVNSINFIGNMRKPLSLAPMLASRAIPDIGKNSAGFFLWQTRKGMHFRSVEKMIFDAKESKKETIKQEYIFDRGNEGLDNPEKSFTKIYSYNITNNKDVMAGQRTGKNSTYRIYFNPHTFEFTRPEQSIFYPTEQEGLNKPPQKKVEPPEADPTTIPKPEMANRIISGIYSVGCLEEKVVGAAATAVNQDNLSDVGQSISRYSSLFSQVVTITVAMNINLCAGDIIKLTLPKVSTESDVDPSQSGLYIIKEISHFSSANRSYSALKVIRDSSGE